MEINIHQPIVSILIAAYNCENFIADTLQSCLNQTWNNLEIIVVDDGSADKTVDVVERFIVSGVKCIKQSKKGACSARNLATQHATGEYIMFLDSDDLLSEDKIENQLKVLLFNNSSTLSFCAWGRFYGADTSTFKYEDQEINKNYYNPLEYLADCWSGKGMWLNSIFLMHRDLISKAGYWNEDLLINQDGEFFMRILLNVEKLVFSGGLVYYRSGLGNSITGSVKTVEKAASLLNSYNICTKYCLPYMNINSNIINALGANYQAFIYQYYSIYPSLSGEAYLMYRQLDITRVVYNGGKLNNLFIKLFGFMKFVKFRHFFKQILSK